MMQWKLFVVVSAMCGMLLMGQSITVTSPNGGENWVQGSTQNITWDTTLTSGTFRINLFDGGTNLGTIAINLPASQHSFNWTVGHLIDAADVGPGVNYLIKVRQQGTAPKDFSDAPFNIVSPAPETGSVQVTRPNGGERVQLLSRYSIKWNSSGISDNVHINLMRNNALLGAIASNAANSGNHEWLIQEIGGNPIVAGGGYKIQVVAANDPGVRDTSNGSFAIQPKFQVVVPNGGETWVMGRDQEIRGIAFGYSDSLRLVLYKRKNRLGTIAANLSASGGLFVFKWKVGKLLNQQSVPAGNDYYVKVESYDGLYADLSNDFFTIQMKALDPGLAATRNETDYGSILEAKTTRIVDPQVYYRFRNLKIETHNGRQIFCFGPYPQSPVKRPISSLYGPVLSGDQLEKRDVPPQQNPERELYFRYLPNYTWIGISGRHAVFKPQARQLVVTAFMESHVSALGLWIRTDNGKEYERNDVRGNSTDLLTFTFDLEMDAQRGAIQPVFKGIEREFKDGITNLGPHWEAAKSRIVSAISNLMNGSSARTFFRDLITSPVYDELGPGKWILGFEVVDEKRLKIRLKDI